MTIQQKQAFGASLLDARTKQGVSQRDCAAHCGVSVVSYQNWEHGTCEPKADRLVLICDFLSLNKEEFV